MAAMAGAVGVRLEKPGAYVLAGDATEPGPASIRRAVRVADCGFLLAAVMLLGAVR
jgi:adenosylcobinamide-phosphate synthase